jgi:hypothetical protein
MVYKVVKAFPTKANQTPGLTAKENGMKIKVRNKERVILP